MIKVKFIDEDGGFDGLDYYVDTANFVVASETAMDQFCKDKCIKDSSGFHSVMATVEVLFPTRMNN